MTTALERELERVALEVHHIKTDQARGMTVPELVACMNAAGLLLSEASDVHRYIQRHLESVAVEAE